MPEPVDAAPLDSGPLAEEPGDQELLNLQAIGVLRTAAWVFFGIFFFSVLLRSLPLRLLDPLWQIGWITTLVDMGGYALIGVLLLCLAQLLSPAEPGPAVLLLRVRGLCRAAALGFLLLAPLLLSALWRDFQGTELQRQRQRQSLQRWELRQSRAIAAASARPELLQAVQAINAQALPAFLASDAPLERQRGQARELLEASAQAARRQLADVSPASWRSILLNNLRLLVLALLFAFGFSSAYAGGPAFPLLASLFALLLTLVELLPGRRSAQRGPADGSQDYYEAMDDEG